MNEKEVKRIEYKDSMGNPREFEVWKDNVISIKEHKAQGEGDRWHYDVVFEDGDVFRIFDVIFVAFASINSISERSK